MVLCFQGRIFPCSFRHNVVYIYKNDDDEISRIAVGTETVTGTVSRVSSDGDGVTIDGTVYKYAENELEGMFDGADTLDIAAGDEVTLYLDAYGYIFDFEATSSADDFAVVLQTGETSGISGGLEIKLFLADGTDRIFAVDDEDIDASIITSSGAWTSAWDETAPASTLIKYGLNSSNEIDTIEVVENETNNTILLIER